MDSVEAFFTKSQVLRHLSQSTHNLQHCTKKHQNVKEDEMFIWDQNNTVQNQHINL